jgi:methionine-rich copper-binding protein CopC
VTRTRAVSGAFAAFAALAAIALLALPAGAHTAMLRASPDRDATAGGAIGHIDLEFLDPVSSVVVSVSYNGVPVAGQTTVAEGELITFTLDQPLNQPGRYQVNYEMISFDSDFTTGGFFFTFDPVAAEAARLELSGPGGFSSTTIAVSVVALVAVIGLLALFVRQIDNRRSQVLQAVDGYDDHYYEDDHFEGRYNEGRYNEGHNYNEGRHYEGRGYEHPPAEDHRW